MERSKLIVRVRDLALVLMASAALTYLAALLATNGNFSHDASQPNKNRTGSSLSGFTLIELSIVLVIIGLIVGGVLVGQDLISAAGVRAQISQIEKYNTAVNTFYGKYGYLPGDIKDPEATQFGFISRGNYPGTGDGNGVIEGNCSSGGSCFAGFAAAEGEGIMAWVDLSKAGLIDGGFNTATASVPNDFIIDHLFPQAKIGRGNYIYIYCCANTLTDPGAFLSTGDGNNYYGLSAITPLPSAWPLPSNPGLTVKEAYSIDTKVDDGLPQSGKVQATYINYTLQNYRILWAAGGGAEGTGNNGLISNAQTPGSATTCFDNGNSSTGAAQNYSVGQNGGAGVNCALSFKFQ